MPRSGAHVSGIALITVLLVMALTIIVATVSTIFVMSSLQSNADNSQRNELIQVADGISEQARAQILGEYQKSLLNNYNYLASLTKNKTFAVEAENGITGAWAVTAVSPPDAHSQWLTLNATARRGDNVQTVVKTISFTAKNDIFELAMLSEDTNCMYCHLNVNGSVGSYNLLRPGWGSEGPANSAGPGAGSGGTKDGLGSKIKGDVYAATNVSKDRDNTLASTVQQINGTIVTGTINTSYIGTKLPADTTGSPRFPPIDAAAAKANAKGTVTGGKILRVSTGTKVTASQISAAGTTPVNGVYDGNLILIGTKDNPITLDGDIYVTGDVVIKGYVKGQGAIYSGRNTYIPGDLKTVNPADKPGTGVCLRITDVDACANANIKAQKDSLRLGARGNTIIGDYTEQLSSGGLQPITQRQSADYYRQQFGFTPKKGQTAKTFYFDKTTGDEVTKNSQGQYVNIDNVVVSSANVVARTGSQDFGSNYNAQDAYTYAMRPGQIASAGSFTSWMDDAVYRASLLGTDAKPADVTSWRAAKAQVSAGSLTAAGLPSDFATTLATAVSNNKFGNYVYKDAAGKILIEANIQDNADIGTVLGVFDSRPTVPETQVREVDAFLYSNRRIAGKSALTAMAINGGMIAKEIGVLAPGRQRPNWLKNISTPTLNSKTSSPVSCSNSSSPYYVANTDDCSLTVNYDYRLRNDGYGFNFVQGEIGQVMEWRIADQISQQVK